MINYSRSYGTGGYLANMDTAENYNVQAVT